MKHLGFCAFVLGVTLAGCTSSDGEADASLTVVNRSDFVIDEIYLTDVGSSSWGANLLSGDALLPDERLTLGVDCGTYDAMLVDQDGVKCELHDLDLCLNDATWLISNNTCDAFAHKVQENAAKAATSQ